MNATNSKLSKPSSILEPEAHVLSTLEADGSRRWLKPKLSAGRLWRRRQMVAYLLIAIFTLIPFVKIGESPLVLLDIVGRRFTILGFTFLPTDTVLLAIFVVGIVIGLFLFTTLFGRVWCGWACPQTVYMEFLVRPIERFFEGTTGRGGHKQNVAIWRTAGKYVAYLVVCVYLANTFLAYFIGVERLGQWITQSPLEHPIPFCIMALVTLAMMVDFCYFREQMCLIACPYGRFQSVLLDQNSLIVSYDQKRGEPRGKKTKRAADQPDQNALPIVGDCIDCRKCVTTCPTGIDIRDGLQMECINCTQCIDACDAVMRKIDRAPGLIRYSSQANDADLSTGLIRPRTIIYPILLAGIIAAFLTVLIYSKSFDAVLLRELGAPYVLTEEGKVRNILKVKITNRKNIPMTFHTSCLHPSDAEIRLMKNDWVVGPSESKTFHISVITHPEAFDQGRAELELDVVNQSGVKRTFYSKLIGPYGTQGGSHE